MNVLIFTSFCCELLLDKSPFSWSDADSKSILLFPKSSEMNRSEFLPSSESESSSRSEPHIGSCRKQSRKPSSLPIFCFFVSLFLFGSMFFAVFVEFLRRIKLGYYYCTSSITSKNKLFILKTKFFFSSQIVKWPLNFKFLN